MTTFIDFFSGAGGASEGLVRAGMHGVMAINHDPTAIATHEANHPAMRHLCENLNTFDMRKLPRAEVLWASPICTEISPAGRRKRSAAQISLLEANGDSDPGDEAFVRTRATFYDVIRATEVWRYAAVVVENVVNVATDWALFDWWLSGMKALGYHVQLVSVSSAHVGDENNPAAAQWRDRLYIVCTREDVRIPDVTPRPKAWCAECDRDVLAVQSWRNPKKRRVGKYQQQYDYRCPEVACRNAIVEPYTNGAESIIDWDVPGVRISDRTAAGLPPLRPTTLGRIETGLAMYPGQRFMAMLRNHARPTGIDRPLATLAASGQHHALVIPSTGADGGPVTAADCHLRMLNSREKLRAQRFPADYVLHGNKTARTLQIGNAVSCNVAQWLGERIGAVL